MRRDELAFLAAFGAIGLASVQLFYFLSIHRLPLGIALLLEYTAPLLVALWARFVLHQQVRPRLWVALGLALFGLSLVVQVWTGVTLDGLGLAFGAITAVSFAAYILMAEHEVGRRDPVSLACYGFLFASLLFALIQPWWSFPFSLVGRRISLLGHLSTHHLPAWGAPALGDRARHGAPVPARDRLAAAHLGDARGDRGDGGAGRGERRRLGLARRVARPSQLVGGRS